MGVRWVAKTLNRPSAASRRGADGRCPEALARRLSSTSTSRSIQGASSAPLPFLPVSTAGRCSTLACAQIYTLSLQTAFIVYPRQACEYRAGVPRFCPSAQLVTMPG